MRNKAIIKWIIYGVFLFFLSVVQQTLLRNITLFGSPPSLIPVAVGIIAVLEGSYAGALMGFVGGILFDASIGINEGFYTIVLPFAGLAIGLVSANYFRKVFNICLAFGIVCGLFCDLIRYLFAVLLQGRGNMLMPLVIIPKSALISALFVPIIFPICKRIYKRFATSEADIEDWS